MDKLLQENIKLRREIAKLQNQELSYGISILEEKPKLKITGVLIAEGVWKGIKYDYEEMKKALSKFKGLPVKVMHGKSEEFGDKTVGRVTKVDKDDILRAITFEAIIEDPKAVQLIKEGVFDAVSIKGGFENIDDSHTPPVGLNYTPIEVSLTGSPACENCILFTVTALSKCLNESTANRKVGEKIMSDEQVEQTEETEEYIEIKENEVLVLPDNWEEIEDFSIVEAEVKPLEQALQELAEKEEEEKEKVKVIKIIKVPAGKYPKTATRVAKIYGYPYPYYGYPYYYYYYPYYYYTYPSMEEILDILPLEEDYRTFMKKCLKEGKSMKECAEEWKKQKGEMEEEEQTELAKVKCPVCGKEFSSKKAFLKHWEEEHAAKYGEYQLVKRLIKKMLEDRTFTRKFKRIMELEDEPCPDKPCQETEKTEEKTEEKKEEQTQEKTEEITQKEKPKEEEHIEKEEVKKGQEEEKKEEERKEERTERTEPVPKTKLSLEEMTKLILEKAKEKGMAPEEVAAELLVGEFKRE